MTVESRGRAKMGSRRPLASMAARTLNRGQRQAREESASHARLSRRCYSEVSFASTLMYIHNLTAHSGCVRHDFPAVCIPRCGIWSSVSIEVCSSISLPFRHACQEHVSMLYTAGGSIYMKPSTAYNVTLLLYRCTAICTLDTT